MKPEKVRVAVVQLTSVLDYRDNLQKISDLLKDLDLKNIDALFLPECFYSMSDGSAPSPWLVDDHNEHYQNIREIAVKNGVALIGGSAATLHNGNVVNRAYNFDREGNDLGHYDKNHLFSCDIQSPDGKKKSIDEGDIYTAGNETKTVDFCQVKVGLGICFDLRYPEMYRNYARQGCEIMTVASAFTVPTGKAHWHTLVRARAIENQCFMVAAAQYGRHNDRIKTFGHSLIVGPWGDILADAQEGEKVITAELDLSEIDKVRKSVKVFS